MSVAFAFNGGLLLNNFLSYSIGSAQFKPNAAACLFVKCNYLFFQEDMFLCSANCYKDRISPIEDLHSCTERCNIKLEENKDFFQRELDSVEVRNM